MAFRLIPSLPVRDRCERACPLLLALLVLVTLPTTAEAAADEQPDKQLLARLDRAGGTVAAFSADGAVLLTAGGDEARVWDGNTFKLLADPLKHEQPVKAAAISSDGRRVVTAAGTTAALWDARTGRRLHVLKHADRVFDAALSPDGRQLATACLDKHARVWDAATGELLTELKHEHPVRSVAFDPTGARLLTGTVLTGVDPALARWPKDNQIDVNRPDAPGDAQVWDIGRRRRVSSFFERYAYCKGRPAFSPDGKRVGVPAGGHGATVFDAATGEHLAEWMYVTGRGDFMVAFSRDGKRFLVAGEDGHTNVDAAAHVLEMAPNAEPAVAGNKPLRYEFREVRGLARMARPEASTLCL